VPNAEAWLLFLLGWREVFYKILQLGSMAVAVAFYAYVSQYYGISLPLVRHLVGVQKIVA
jgi:hypothetical protein